MFESFSPLSENKKAMDVKCTFGFYNTAPILNFLVVLVCLMTYSKLLHLLHCLCLFIDLFDGICVTTVIFTIFFNSGSGKFCCINYAIEVVISIMLFYV